MSEQLIPYSINESGEVIISGKELHEFLQIKTPFKMWIPRMIEYGFKENEDYEILIEQSNTAGGVQYFKDYMLKADMAKEICMLQRSDRGRQARLYFINLEKEFNSPEAVLDRLKQLLGKSTSPTTPVDIKYESANGETSYFQGSVAPTMATMSNQVSPTQESNNYNSENFSDLVVNFRDAAKMFGIKENLFINWLILRNYCYRDKYGSIKPYSGYMKYFILRPYIMISGHSGIQTLINSSGIDFFSSLLSDEGVIEGKYVN